MIFIFFILRLYANIFSRVSQTVSVSVETKMEWNLFCEDKDATLLARFIQLCVHTIQ